MPTTDLDRYIAARLLQADLSAIDAHFSEVGISNMAGIVHLKNAFLALANMGDFERTVRDIYKEHRTHSEKIWPHVVAHECYNRAPISESECLL